MQVVLFEHGKTPVEVQSKLLIQLEQMFELRAGSLQFNIRSHHVTKAVHVIRRLRGQSKSKETEVWFDSSYFTDGD